MIPASRNDLKQWCLRELGHPVIEINVDDDQLEDRMDEAFDFWHEWHYDGSDETYIVYQLTADDITNRYIPMDPNILRVINMFPVGNGGGTASSSMFNVEYQLRLSDMYNMQSEGLTYYTMTKTNLEMMEMILNGQIPVRYSKVSNKLYLDWDWQSKAVVGNYIIIKAYVILDPTQNIKIYNDMMLKKYTAAMFKKQWGTNLKKFAGVQLPGGVTLNGDIIYNEAIADIEKLEESIRETYSSPAKFFTG